MVAVQAHGFSFEDWVRDTFFDGYRSNGSAWDIPALKNCSRHTPARWHGVPVSIKTAKYGSPLGLGDVLRQRQIAEPFLMIAGFWRQRTATEKWIEDIGLVYFTASAWSALWGELTLAELKVLDAIVKDRAAPYPAVRLAARAWKRDMPSTKTASLVINPKIDSKSQRRVQCSLPFKTFWTAAGREPLRQDLPTLFDKCFPNPILSAARTFNA